MVEKESSIAEVSKGCPSPPLGTNRVIIYVGLQTAFWGVQS